MQRAPLANAACCILHPTARQYCGEAFSPSKPSASCCFLIPSEKSCQCLFFMWASAFCCAGLCVLLRGPFVFSCASLCLLLRGSVPSLVRFSAFFCVNQWRGKCGLPQWKWRGDGTVELGAAGRGFPVGGFGEIDRCFEKRSAAGWIGPTAALACAERQVSEPITLTAYATMSYIPKFQIGNETVTIFRRWACPTLTAVCLPNFRVQR